MALSRAVGMVLQTRVSNEDNGGRERRKEVRRELTLAWSLLCHLTLVWCAVTENSWTDDCTSVAGSRRNGRRRNKEIAARSNFGLDSRVHARASQVCILTQATVTGGRLV